MFSLSSWPSWAPLEETLGLEYCRCVLWRPPYSPDGRDLSASSLCHFIALVLEPVSVQPGLSRAAVGQVRLLADGVPILSVTN